MSYRFESDIPLRWKDIDAGGVLNNAVYMTLVEQSRYDYFTHLGLLGEGEFPFLLAETKIRFHQPGLVGMKISVASRVSKLGGKSFRMDYEVRNGDSVLATVEATLVFVDADRKSSPIPAEVRTKISDFERIPARG